VFATEPEPTPAERRAAMTWAQRLKRVFGIDLVYLPGNDCSMLVPAEWARQLEGGLVATSDKRLYRALVCNAHEAAGRWALGGRQVMAGSARYQPMVLNES
jgi:hypothetical protein